jgi:hypothetical protein
VKTRGFGYPGHVCTEMQVQIRQVLLSKRGCSAKIERPVTGFKEDPENDSQIERRCDSFQSRDTVASGAAKARIVEIRVLSFLVDPFCFNIWLFCP